MSRYDGLIIPRSYSEYINKTDAATLLQALQQSGVMDAAPTSGSNHPVKSGGLVPVDTVTLNNMKSVTSNAVFQSINALTYIKELNNTNYTSFLQIPMGVYAIATNTYANYTDKPSGLAGGRIIFIAGASYIGSNEQICLLATSKDGHLYLGHCYGGTPRYIWKQII